MEIDTPELPRDVLAAVALHALLSNPNLKPDVDIAKSAYQIADNMLAARERES